jgi:pyroglutamyl-peptidase
MSPARKPAGRPHILVTAFESFDDRPVNRSGQWLDAFLEHAEATALAHVADLTAAELPVDFVELPRALARLWRAERPDVWILTGESGAGDAIRVERVAVNLLDATIPDNAGRRRVDAEVLRGGPPAYFATLEPRKARAALERGGARSVLSLSAGSYCCNQAFYLARHLTRRAKTRVIFLHIPRIGLGRGRGAPGIDAAAKGLAAVVRMLARG